MDSFFRKLSLRLDEMIHEYGEEAKIGAPEDVTGRPKVKAARSRHPNEDPFIKRKDFGFVNFYYSKVDKGGFVTDKEEPLVLKDFNTHTIVFGESGSGKTAFALNQIYEEFFRSTHIEDGPDREKLKFGGLVIEAKGDFSPKTWDLAQKYGRMDDIIFFGPTHMDNRYDMFADPTETAQQRSDKMMQLLLAFGAGQKGQDPFWDHAARKLFTHIFLLHQNLAEAKVPEVPRMSFELLNLLIMDKGAAKNQSALDTDRDLFKKTYDDFLKHLDGIRLIVPYLIAECERISSRVDTLFRETDETLSEVQEVMAIGPTDEAGVSTTEPARVKAWQKEIFQRKNTVARQKAVIGNMKVILECNSNEDFSDPLVPRLEKLRMDIAGILNAEDDTKRGEAFDKVIENGEKISRVIKDRVSMVSEATMIDSVDSLMRLKNYLIDLSNHLDSCHDIGERLSNWKSPTPVHGALRNLLNKYEDLVRQNGLEPQNDSIASYFNEEFLNVVNDKTSGSIGMMASNVVNLFVHPPFNKIFNSDATFNMAQLMDEGKLLVLDMPQALYGANMTVTALVLKIDFFRAVLSRKRLTVVDQNTGQVRGVNQERELVYFCDEFASIASTGDTTGEAGFLDKCREYKCSVILGLQSIPMLLKKFTDGEVDAILTNCANKIFLRNSDKKTNTYAEEVCGSKRSISVSFKSSGIESALDNKASIGARNFSSSLSSGKAHSADSFPKLKDGECVIRLNPRFGKNQVQKTQLKLHIIKTPEPKDLFPFPEYKA